MTTSERRDLVTGLLADLAAEAEDLQQVLADLGDDDWWRPTPAVGWTIHDQISHLAHFDFVTRLAISEPEAFGRLRAGLPDLQSYVDSIGPANRSRDGADMRRWWREQHRRLADAVRQADPQVRVPWFGPPMSLPSKLTARIMETWAHGQDVVDALDRRRSPSPRIRHVARIGVLAFANSFAARGLDVPQQQVHIRLDAPDGAVWEFGSSGEDLVAGPAEDFCLVVTQRRHLEDTALTVRGPVAQKWMSIAQAFAGPPGPGRAPIRDAVTDPSQS